MRSSPSEKVNQDSGADAARSALKPSDRHLGLEKERVTANQRPKVPKVPKEGFEKFCINFFQPSTVSTVSTKDSHRAREGLSP